MKKKDEQKNRKRKDYLDWNECFMLMVDLIAKRSKDPNTQCGSCIVNDENIVIGLGYNGFPRGCSDDELPWGREGAVMDNKYAHVVHAEANAIMNANNSVRGCKLYVNLFPCNECAKVIIQSGIKEVIYNSDKYADVDIFKVSRKLLEMAKIKLTQYAPKNKLEVKNIENK